RRRGHEVVPGPVRVERHRVAFVEAAARVIPFGSGVRGNAFARVDTRSGGGFHDAGCARAPSEPGVADIARVDVRGRDAARRDVAEERDAVDHDVLRDLDALLVDTDEDAGV